MAKYKEIVSMTLDMLKENSDDSFYTEEHIIFLAGRYRSFLLKQRYASDLKKQIPASNYQTLCLELEPIASIDGFPCAGYYLRTKEEVPETLPCGNTRVYASGSYYQSDITFVSKDRMKYTNNSKWTQNIIYGCLDPSNHIYLNSANPQFKYLKEINMQGIFENAEEASELECENSGDEKCDIMDRDFPLEDALIAPMIDLIVKELSPSMAVPEDVNNDAKEDRK